MNSMKKKEKVPAPTFLSRIEDGLLIIVLGGMIFLSFTQILLRNIFEMGQNWIDPLIHQMLLWATLIGSMVATREHTHITVDVFYRFLPRGRIRFAVNFFCDFFATGVCVFLTYSTFRVFYMEFQVPQGGHIIPGLPLWGTLLTMPVAFCIMTIRFIRFTFLSFMRIIMGEDSL